VLSRRFGARGRNIAFERLVGIRQHENVEYYIQEFEILVSQVPQTSKD